MTNPNHLRISDTFFRYTSGIFPVLSDCTFVLNPGRIQPEYIKDQEEADRCYIKLRRASGGDAPLIGVLSRGRTAILRIQGSITY